MHTDTYLIYVEDDEDDVMLMQELMNTQAGVRLVTVGNGQELLQLLEEKRNSPLPCLIIMDNNTPRLSGVETARAIRKDAQFGQLPLVLLTTAPSRTDEAFCQAHNIRLFTKPATFPEWEALSRSFLEQCRPAPKK